jgi:FkbM family methyltransferase
MDFLGFFIYTVAELYRSLTKNTVYTPREVLDNRIAEINFKLFGGREADGLILDYGRVSDVLGLRSEIINYKCYDFVTDKPDPYIISGGGNIGVCTLRMLEEYPGAHIVVFEPQPDVFRRLQKNILNNGFVKNATLVNAAISDREGEAVFNRTVDGVTDCCASLEDTPGMNDHIIVKTVTLCPYIDKRVDLLKLDIEGSEYPALKKLCDEGLLKLVDRLIIEYHPIRFNGKVNGYLLPLLSLLEREGYYVDLRIPHEVDGELNALQYMDGFSFTMIYASRDYHDINKMGAYAHYYRRGRSS